MVYRAYFGARFVPTSIIIGTVKSFHDAKLRWYKRWDSIGDSACAAIIVAALVGAAFGLIRP